MISKATRTGFTLLEMTVVIMVLLTLMGTGLFVSTQYNDWERGRAAAEELRSVYSAQRLYLADNPTAVIENITDADLIPYLVNRATAIPTVKSLTDSTLTIRVNVNPPNINDGSGGIYDPSNSITDSLWDVGK